MNVIKVKKWNDIPQGYTGIVEYESGAKIWLKNGNYHRENGPAFVRETSIKSWYLDGKYIWSSSSKLNLTNQIILSKTQHPEYPLVQVWKILDKNKVYEQTIISGIEELIIE